MNEQTLKQIIEDKGLFLYDTETVSENDTKIFRVYITSPNGVSLDQCTEITKIISPILDLDPPVSGQYTLEVSSPGIDRKLTNIDHYKYSIGSLAKLKLSDGRKIKCEIRSVDGNNITIYNKESKAEETITLGDVINAKTYFEW